MALSESPDTTGASPQRFKTRPTSIVVQKFKEHLEKTNHPESFPGIYCGTLPKTEKFEILHEFHLKQEKRADQDMAYCPYCNRTNQYLKGSLIYLPDLQRIAAIGNECADKTQLGDARNRVQEERVRRFMEDFLLRELPRLSDLKLKIMRLLPEAEEAHRTAKQLRSFMNPQLKLLRRLKQYDFKLMVEEQIDQATRSLISTSGASGRAFRTRSVGQLEGLQATRERFQPQNSLSESLDLLSLIPSANDEEEALEEIVKMNELEMKFVYEKYNKAIKIISRARVDIDEFWHFFKDQNIYNINIWASFLNQQDTFTISIGKENDGRRILKKRQHGYTTTMQVSVTHLRYAA